jgi:hypothetical protein
MSNMTLEDLRTSLNNFMPVWCDIEREGSGEIVIRTGLVEDDKGQLVPLEDTRSSSAPLSTLTAEEREAINRAVAVADEFHDYRLATTLRKLLARLG